MDWSQEGVSIEGEVNETCSWEQGGEAELLELLEELVATVVVAGGGTRDTREGRSFKFWRD